jgi:drug/metabolite transporter (DMT)-like permease
MVPLVTPFLLHALVRERLTKGEFLGTGVAVIGLVVMSIADAHVSMETLIGDLICLLSMLFLAVYVALGRRNRDFGTIWLYVVPLYWVAGLSCMAVSLRWNWPWQVGTRWDFAVLVGLAIVPTITGHSILNWAMKHFRGQIVSLMCLTEFFYAGIMAYFLLDELPDWSFYAAVALILTGAAIALRSMPSPIPPPEGP